MNGISKFSPSSSVNGEMKKKWMIKDDTRYLMKVSTRDYGQQSVNELIASKLHERLERDNFSLHTLEKAVIEGTEVLCSLNPLFTDTESEFVSAYQLIKNVKVSNNSNLYEEMISQAMQYGLQEKAGSYPWHRFLIREMPCFMIRRLFRVADDFWI